MAGIYVHIPFCLQRCHYCDFYSTTRLELAEQFVAACVREVELRKDYCQGESANSLYFGGGTPSALHKGDLEKILNAIHQYLPLSNDIEQTMEVNPDDVTSGKLAAWKSLGFNRISMGVQSFREEDLKLMNRRHHPAQSVQAIHAAYAAGFDSISIDLIYGVPDMPRDQWTSNLLMIENLPVNHLSAYHLTIEKHTVFDQWVKQGKLSELSEEESWKQYQILIQEITRMGWEQYEISNFAKDERYSRHNMKYWTGETYLGLGPSAHSFQGTSRHWNASSLTRYLKQYQAGRIDLETEQIDAKTARNELIMTRLRTKWGIHRKDWEKHVSTQTWENFLHQAAIFIRSGDLVADSDRISVVPDSFFRVDGIIAQLFEVDV